MSEFGVYVFFLADCHFPNLTPKTKILFSLALASSRSSPIPILDEKRNVGGCQMAPGITLLQIGALE